MARKWMSPFGLKNVLRAEKLIMFAVHKTLPKVFKEIIYKQKLFIPINNNFKSLFCCAGVKGRSILFPSFVQLVSWYPAVQ